MTNAIETGTTVYVNRSAYGSDGHYGIHTVVRADGDTLYLARGECDVSSGNWDLMISARLRCVVTDATE